MNNSDQLNILFPCIPDTTLGFRPIADWRQIEMDTLEDEALKIYLDKENHPDHELIKRDRSRAHIIAYLRYDFKKILLRTRLFYIDNFGFEEKESVYYLTDEPLIGFGYFEPLVNCFICAESIGHFRNYPRGQQLTKTLTNMGDGYKTYAKIMDDFFRNGLAHNFRPYGAFYISLNTQTEYEAPSVKDEQLRINVPHFIDSLILELEKLISELKDRSHDKSVDAYLKYLTEFKNVSQHFYDAIIK